MYQKPWLGLQPWLFQVNAPSATAAALGVAVPTPWSWVMWKMTEKLAEKPPIVVAGSPWSPWELTEDTVTRSESATALKATCRWSNSARSRSLGVVLRWGSRWDLFSSQWMAPDLHCSRWYGRILLYTWSASWWGLLSYTFFITY